MSKESKHILVLYYHKHNSFSRCFPISDANIHTHSSKYIWEKKISHKIWNLVIFVSDTYTCFSWLASFFAVLSSSYLTSYINDANTGYNLFKCTLLQRCSKGHSDAHYYRKLLQFNIMTHVMTWFCVFHRKALLCVSMYVLYKM